MIENIWVFNGADSTFPGGVFIEKKIAEKWITEHQLTGVLTLYPINKGVYDWAIEQGAFSPTKDYQYKPSFIEKFNSASQEHYHYLDGALED
jgi:hypothetical protein